MIQWRGGNEYLLMDPPAHFKVWKRQFVKTKEHWASVMSSRVVEVMIMKLVEG